MKITEKRIKIKDLVNGYVNNDEEGVVAYGGKLDVRPPYQREFIYNEKQQQAVIKSILNGFPLNVIYWTRRDDGTCEILDGQQRTLSICSYINDDFSYEFKYFSNLTNEEKEKILNYELMVFICEGSDKEKLDWFKIINIAGVKLTKQELRNAVYSGKWLNDAKKYFSKINCPAYQIGSIYMKGTPIRQDYLETVLNWISNGNTEEYMAKHQNKHDARELWLYYQSITNWIEATFVNYRKEMKGLDYGYLYNIFSNIEISQDELEKQISSLMIDDEITNKKGIYYYIFDEDEKHLNIRTFTEKQKREVYEEQNGICKICGKKFDLSKMEADHIIPWSKGGKTIIDNCQLLCKKCNMIKSNK